MFLFFSFAIVVAHNTFNLRTKAHLFSHGRFSDALTDGLMHGVKCDGKSLSCKLMNRNRKIKKFCVVLQDRKKGARRGTKLLAMNKSL